MAKKSAVRTASGLRDILFDEIDALRKPDGDPRRAVAVGQLARQIIGTARLEMEFHRTSAALSESGRDVSLGTLALGSN